MHHEGKPVQHCFWQPTADEHMAKNHLEEAYPIDDLQSMEHIVNLVVHGNAALVVVYAYGSIWLHMAQNLAWED